MTQEQAVNELAKSEPKNEIVVYQPNETMRLEVLVENESVWLTQSKIGELFGVDRTVINRHKLCQKRRICLPNEKRARVRPLTKKTKWKK